MQIYSVFDEEFRPYGQVLTGYNTDALVAAMEEIPMPAAGTSYQPGIESLEKLDIFADFRDRAYGGMPIQIGMCWGHNTKLNCLEYHMDSEVNIGDADFVLLLAKRDEIIDGKLDTAKVKAFKAPRGAVVEVYATSLHYAPCGESMDKGFRVAVVLPKGTNEAAPEFKAVAKEDSWITARNKWLLAHPESSEAQNGAYVGLVGENIDIEK